MSSIVNRVKEAVSPSRKEDAVYTDTTTGSSTQPRTDTATHGLGSNTTHSTSHSTHGSTGDNYSLGGDNRGTSGPASRTDGPHESNLMNKADPRVDSDRDYSKNMGANLHGTASTGTGVAGTTGTSGTHGTHGTTGTTGLHGEGPHSSGLANKADPRIDSDRDGSRNMGANPHGTTDTTHSAAHSVGAPGTASALDTGAAGSFGTTSGHSSAGQYGTHSATGTGPASTTQGPHGSNLANKADPRVDSDRDGSRTLGSNPQDRSGTRDTTGSHGYGHNTAGLAAGAGVGAGAGAAAAGHHSTSHGTDSANRGLGGPASKTDGPHESNVANKMDPRIDSDRDHSKNMGANPHGTATTGASDTTHGTGGGAFFTGGQTGTHGTEHTGSTRTHGAPEGTYGPHDSRAANAADPRVDSDRDGSRNMGTTGHHGTTGTHTGHHDHGTTDTHTGTTGSHTGHHGTTGTHTGATGTHAPHTGTTGSHGMGTGAGAGLGAAQSHTGPAPNTAGPHKSDLLNKLDPRVDSNLDGSRTVGGNKTDDSRDATRKHKDPTDAAQVPPSVLQKHVGDVELQHDDHTHQRAKRHSISHQEQHRGL